jgi:hypothetical protein
MGRPSTYASEVRERAVRAVQERASEYPSQRDAALKLAYVADQLLTVGAAGA